MILMQLMQYFDSDPDKFIEKTIEDYINFKKLAYECNDEYAEYLRNITVAVYKQQDSDIWIRLTFDNKLIVDKEFYDFNSCMVKADMLYYLQPII